jgi:hypothetical protein
MTRHWPMTICLMTVACAWTKAASAAGKSLSNSDETAVHEVVSQIKHIADQCRSQESLFIYKIHDSIQPLDHLDGGNASPPSLNQFHSVLANGRVAETLRFQMTTQEWHKLVTLWSTALMAFAEELDVWKGNPIVQMRPPIQSVDEDLLAITTPLSLPVVAAFNPSLGDTWLDVWALSPAMAVGGVVRLPFDMLAFVPRAIVRTRQPQINRLAFETAARHFDEAVHQIPGKAP